MATGWRGRDALSRMRIQRDSWPSGIALVTRDMPEAAEDSLWA